MKIVVFGASGRVGQKVVSKLLTDGYEVRALVHNNNPFEPSAKLEVVKGDIHSPEDVRKAIRGCTGVVSALSSWGTKSKDIQVSAMANIIPAMESEHVKRIVSVTGSGVFGAEDRPSWLDKISRAATRLVARKVFDDGEQHIKLLRQSKLDWTVIRSPIMKESGHPGSFELSGKAPTPWASVVRDDVAKAMTDLVTSQEWLKQAPFIKRR